jgi:hypothetical protein
MPGPSSIERALYGEWAEVVTKSGEVGDHCLLEFSLFLENDQHQSLKLIVAPWDHEHRLRHIAVFQHVQLQQIVQVAHSDDAQLPWGIVGFHSTEQPDGFWSFGLNCNAFRLSWDSKWPSIEFCEVH